MDETFFVVSFMAVSSEILKKNNNNKFLSNSFLAVKLTYTKIFVSSFSTSVLKRVTKEFIIIFSLL